MRVKIQYISSCTYFYTYFVLHLPLNIVPQYFYIYCIYKPYLEKTCISSCTYFNTLRALIFAIFADYSKKFNFAGTYFRRFVWKIIFCGIYFFNLFLAFFHKIFGKIRKILFRRIYFRTFDSRKIPKKKRENKCPRNSVPLR